MGYHQPTLQGTSSVGYEYARTPSTGRTSKEAQGARELIANWTHSPVGYGGPGSSGEAAYPRGSSWTLAGGVWEIPSAGTGAENLIR